MQSRFLFYLFYIGNSTVQYSMGFRTVQVSQFHFVPVKHSIILHRVTISCSFSESFFSGIHSVADVVHMMVQDGVHNLWPSWGPALSEAQLKHQ